MELQANDVVIIIGALTTAVVTIMMAFANMKRSLMQKMDENIARTVEGIGRTNESIDKTNETLDKTSNIEKSVNGQSDRLNLKLQSLQKEIDGLEGVVKEQRRAASELVAKYSAELEKRR